VDEVHVAKIPSQFPPSFGHGHGQISAMDFVSDDFVRAPE
jgi:hypothetical protein